MVGQQSLPRRQHVKPSEPCKIMISSEQARNPPQKATSGDVPDLLQLLALYTLVWVV